LIGIAEAKNFTVMERAAELGYDINRCSNGLNLPNTAEAAKKYNLPYHPKRGRHSTRNYTGPVNERLRQLQELYDNGVITDANLLDEIAAIEGSIAQDLLSGKLRLNSRYPWYPLGG
jgi:hypothetical protein